MMVLSQQVKEVKEQEQKEEVNGKTDQNNRKKVPVLTISLRPGKELGFMCICLCTYIYCAQVNNTYSIYVFVTVVVLETLNSALKMHESLPSNGKVRQVNPTMHIQ